MLGLPAEIRGKKLSHKACRTGVGAPSRGRARHWGEGQRGLGPAKSAPVERCARRVWMKNPINAADHRLRAPSNRVRTDGAFWVRPPREGARGTLAPVGPRKPQSVGCGQICFGVKDGALARKKGPVDPF
jgi:hypothetical protein